MSSVDWESCEFVTDRLRVAPWHAAARHGDLDLGEVIAALLTAPSTTTLPAAGGGDRSVDRASAWIEERAAGSLTLLAVGAAHGRAVGLLVLNEVPVNESTIEVQFGYLVGEGASGESLATELVAGLVAWAREQQPVSMLSVAVDAPDEASARVFLENGFERISDGEKGADTYKLGIEHGDEWDGSAEGWDKDANAIAYANAAFESLAGVLRSRGTTLVGAHVIDFGCGTGLLTEQLVAAGATVRAVDTSPAMLAVLDAKVGQRGWTNVTTSAELPNAKVAYELIVCSSVCSFLDDYPGTVGDLLRRLGPGGIFVQWDWERNDGDSDGLSRSEIIQALSSAGFEEISVSVGFTVSVGGQTMSPLMGQGRRPSFSATES